MWSHERMRKFVSESNPSDVAEKLFQSFRYGNMQVVQLMVECNADINTLHHGTTLISKACADRYDSYGNVQTLLDLKADPHAHMTEDRAHPLLTAVIHHNPDIVWTLLNAGVWTSASTTYHHQALTYSICDRFIDCLEVFLDYGISVNHVPFYCTLAEHAAHNGQIRALKLLVKRGASLPNRLNIGICFPSIVRYLLRQGVDPFGDIGGHLYTDQEYDRSVDIVCRHRARIRACAHSILAQTFSETGIWDCIWTYLDTPIRRSTKRKRSS